MRALQVLSIIDNDYSLDTLAYIDAPDKRVWLDGRMNNKATDIVGSLLVLDDRSEAMQLIEDLAVEWDIEYLLPIVYNRAFFYYRRTSWPIAFEFARKLLDQSRNHNNKEYEMHAHMALCEVYYQITDTTNLIKHSHLAFEIADSINHDRGKASVFRWWGLTAAALEEPDVALEHYYNALAIHRKNDDEPSVAMLLNNIGQVERQLEDYTQAFKSFEEALDIYKKYSGQQRYRMDDFVDR